MVEPSTRNGLGRIESIVRESIRQSMRALLGEQGARAIFFHLKLDHYESDADEFHSRLTSIFQGGAATIEKTIVRDLYRRLDLPAQDWSGFDYERSIEYAMKVGAGSTLETASRQRDFDFYFRDSMLSVLNNLLGEEMMRTVVYGLSLHKAAPIEYVHEKLSTIFKLETRTAEKAIIQEVYRNLKMPYAEGDDFDFDFLKEFEKAKSRFDSTREKSAA